MGGLFTRSQKTKQNKKERTNRIPRYLFFFCDSPIYTAALIKAPGIYIRLYWFFFKPGGSITIFVSLACKWNRTWFTLLKCPQGCGDLDLQITRLQDAVRLIFLFCIHKGVRPTSERTFARWIRACMAEEYTKKKRASGMLIWSHSPRTIPTSYNERAKSLSFKLCRATNQKQQLNFFWLWKLRPGGWIICSLQEENSTVCGLFNNTVFLYFVTAV